MRCILCSCRWRAKQTAELEFLRVWDGTSLFRGGGVRRVTGSHLHEKKGTLVRRRKLHKWKDQGAQAGKQCLAIRKSSGKHNAITSIAPSNRVWVGRHCFTLVCVVSRFTARAHYAQHAHLKQKCTINKPEDARAFARSEIRRKCLEVSVELKWSRNNLKVLDLNRESALMRSVSCWVVKLYFKKLSLFLPS